MQTLHKQQHSQITQLHFGDHEILTSCNIVLGWVYSSVHVEETWGPEYLVCFPLPIIGVAVKTWF